MDGENIGVGAPAAGESAESAGSQAPGSGAGSAPENGAVGNGAAGNSAPENGVQEKGAPENGSAGGQQEAEREQEAKQDPDDSPISDWSRVDLGLGRDAQVDPDLVESFGRKAVELGLTPKQARALAGWQLEAGRLALEGLLDSGVKELARDWGAKAGANQQAVGRLITRIDRKLGDDSFSKALGRSGATCHAAVCKGLLAVAEMLSEDSIGGGAGAPMPQAEESALEGLEAAFRQARGK